VTPPEDAADTAVSRTNLEDQLIRHGERRHAGRSGRSIGRRWRPIHPSMSLSVCLSGSLPEWRQDRPDTHCFVSVSIEPTHTANQASVRSPRPLHL